MEENSTVGLLEPSLVNLMNFLSPAQEVGGTLIGEDGLVVMPEAESEEWYQIRMVSMCLMPCAPVQPLLRGVFPSAASTALQGLAGRQGSLVVRALD